MELFRQLVYETALCIYVFIYLSFLICSIQFLKEKKKEMLFWIWGN